MSSPAPSALARARSLELPSRDEMLRRDPAVQHFWLANRGLLDDAWTEWEAGLGTPPRLDDSLIDATLRTAVADAWAEPTTEAAVRNCWNEVAPGVFQAQFFDADSEYGAEVMVVQFDHTVEAFFPAQVSRSGEYRSLNDQTGQTVAAGKNSEFWAIWRVPSSASC